MALIVQKFGGSSVADRERVFRAARLIAQAQRAGDQVVAVVSAQGDTTDRLLGQAQSISPSPSPRELDALLATGEQASAALLCMALQTLGVPAVSLTGWQAGFCTDGRHTGAVIRRLEVGRIRRELAQGRVVVAAGFQGVDDSGDITTLGRGGSDTSAVALACALHASQCLIYTDVDGVYTADPRRVQGARRLKEISFAEMRELAAAGAQVLHGRSVELAHRHALPLTVLSSREPGPGTLVREDRGLEASAVTGVTADDRVSLLCMELTQAAAARSVLQRLADGGVALQQVWQSAEELRLLIPDAAAAQAQSLLEAVSAVHACRLCGDVACLSVVGSGLRSDAAALPRLLQALETVGQYPQWLSAGETRISVLIPRARVRQAVQSVHEAFFPAA